jgi:hypothetical protein
MEDVILRLEIPHFSVVRYRLDLLDRVLRDFQVPTPSRVRLEIGVQIHEVVRSISPHLGVQTDALPGRVRDQVDESEGQDR